MGRQDGGILGFFSFATMCLYPAKQGLEEGIWGMGKEAHKEKVPWTGLSGTCGGHVAGPWSPGATSPACEALCGFLPSSQLLWGKGGLSRPGGPSRAKRGTRHYPSSLAYPGGLSAAGAHLLKLDFS